MKFVKYQGTGNDFVILDGRNSQLPELDVKLMCDRRFGIGADGLMILKNRENFDFEMVYFNSDGNLSSMCGNGGRCIAHYAASLGLGTSGIIEFSAVDGIHKAEIQQDFVRLTMNDVLHWEKRSPGTFVLNTGSPHFVSIIDGPVRDFNLNEFARSIRYSEEFKKDGVNVNAVAILDNSAIEMRTYERGVEGETMSCGTGVTAAALALQLHLGLSLNEVHVKTPGGDLSVSSRRFENGFTEVVLAGPVKRVFEGEYYPA